MKKILVLLSLAFAIATSCEKENPDPTPEEAVGETKEVYIDATSPNTWHYYCATEKKVVGTGEIVKEDEAWGKKDNWDFAIQGQYIKTNSGASTSSGKGGLYTLGSDITFADAMLSSLGDVDAAFDAIESSGRMGGTVVLSLSTARVAIMKGMPPTWLPAPIYVFRSDDGAKYFKVEFTQYKDAENISGHVKFNIAEIY